MRMTTQSWASCVRNKEMRLNVYAVSPTHAESPKEMTVNHRKKKSRWLHNSRRRNCRCWMRSKPNCLVVCEQKNAPSLLAARIKRSSAASGHLRVPQPTLQSKRQPKNSTSDTSQTDRIRNAWRTLFENNNRGTNTLREV